MRFGLNEDQSTFATVLGQMLGSPEAGFKTVEGWGRNDYGAALDARSAIPRTPRASESVRKAEAVASRRVQRMLPMS